MKHLRRDVRIALLTVVVTILVIGCDSPDERLVRVATQNSELQAQQNRDMAHLNQAAVENHRRVVEATEATHQAVASLERDLYEQRGRIDEERRSLASERYREWLLAPILTYAGLLLVTSLPLVLIWYLLSGLRNERDEELSELVLGQILAHFPPVLFPTPPTQPGIDHQPATNASCEPEPPF